MNDLPKFTTEAMSNILEGMLVADEVEEVAPPSDPPIFPPVPARGKFEIDSIVIRRFRDNMLRITFVMSDDLELAIIEAHLEVGDKLILGELDMKLSMRLS